MYTDRGSSKTNSVCPTERLQCYLHISRYRISYTRWTPGNFSSLHQRMVTCPWMRQLFSLPQCSVQHPLPLPSTCSPLLPCKTCYQQTFSAWKKMVHFVDFLLSFFNVIFFCFVLDYCFVIQLNNLPIFFLFSSCWSVKTIWISKKWEIVTLANIFFLQK